jgi:hypothetical protein
LNGRSQFVSIDGCNSGDSPVCSGVPQGSILGPTLFIAYIDPLLRQFSVKFPDFLLQAYADDSSQFIPVKKSIADFEALVQPALNFICDWIRSAGLSLNATKCQAIIFRYGRNVLSVEPKFYVDGQLLEFCEEVKYLGVTFDSHLTFSSHVRGVVRKATNMIGALRRKLGRYTSPLVLGSVYNACIRSVLEYGAVCWDPIFDKDVADLERAQFYALRLYLNDFNISYKDALQKAGWSSLSDRRKRLKLGQFFKFYHGHHDFNNVRFEHRSLLCRTSDRFFRPHALVIPRHNYEAFKQSFVWSCTSLWNYLCWEPVFASYHFFHSYVANVVF